jgi:spore germination cell wall hydrolase CwlJ-like protein
LSTHEHARVLSRARLRASTRRLQDKVLVGAAGFGVMVGLAMGCAYIGGSNARDALITAKAVRLAEASNSAYSAVAMAEAVGGLDQGALAIARRHDPYTVAGGAQRDRQATLFAARLGGADSKKVGLRLANRAEGPAQPFRMAGALDASRDLECLTQAVYYEARGEGASGMQAVAQVVLNRVRHPAFPKSVCGVVFQGSARGKGCQFSFACDGSMRRGVQRAVWIRAEKIAAKALSGFVMPEVGSSTHFHTTGVSPAWGGRLMRVAQVGSHIFYRFGGRSGSSSAFAKGPYAAPKADEFQPVYASLLPTEGLKEVGERAAYKILFTGSGEAAAASADRAEAAQAFKAAEKAQPDATSAPAKAAEPVAPTGEPTPAAKPVEAAS